MGSGGWGDTQVHHVALGGAAGQGEVVDRWWVGGWVGRWVEIGVQEVLLALGITAG